MIADRFSNVAIQTLESNGLEAKSFQQIVSVYHLLYQRQSDLTANLENRYVNCYGADLLTYASIIELNNDEAESAIRYATNANQFVNGNPVNENVLFNSYHVIAGDRLNEGDYDAAIVNLSKALELKTSPELNCQLAYVTGVKAMQLLSINELQNSENVLMSAAERCPNFVDLARMKGKLTLAKGIDAMRFGRYNEASYYLLKLTSDSYLSQQSRALLHKIPLIKNFISQYNRSSSLERLPNVNAVVCRLSGEDCEMLELYNKYGVRIGAAKPDSGEIHFFGKRDNEFTVFRSHDNDFYFNEVLHYPGAGTYGKGLLDEDRDNLPDWQYEISEGKIISETQLSGRIALKFSAAITDRTIDVFSKPDLLIEVYKNNIKLGSTETQLNTYLPVFSTVANLHYKFGDKVLLRFLDDDCIEFFGECFFESFDYLGSLIIQSLPNTGFYNVNSNIGIYLEVRDSTLPEGMSNDFESWNKGNPFESDIAYQSQEITDFLVASYDAQVHSTWMELLGSVAVSEVVLRPFKNLTLLERLILMMAGHEVTNKVLTEQTNP